MAADYTIRGDTRLDAGGFSAGLGKITSLAKSGLGMLATAGAAAAGAIAGVSVASVKLASDLTEVQNVVDVTFGANADMINDWAEAADTSFGLSTLAAKQYTGTLGAMLKSMGLADDQVLQMSTDMVGLAGDFASFYNLDISEAFEKIRSGISGETEPLKQLGINMSVANLEAYALSQGITTAYKDMDQAAQATLRYNYLMSVSADAQGDFVRTQDSLANQMRIAQLQIQEMGATIGSALLPMATEGAKTLNGMLESLRTGFESGGINGLFERLEEVVGSLATMIAAKAPELAAAAVDLLTALVNGLVGASPALLTAGAQIVTAVGAAIAANGPQLLSSFTSLLSQFGAAVTAYAPMLLPTALGLLQQFVTAFSTYAPMLVQQGAAFLQQLGQGLVQGIPTFLAQALPLVLQFTSSLRSNFGALVSAGIDLLLNLAQGIINSLPVLLEYVPQIVTNIAGLINDNAPKLLKAGLQLIVMLGKGLLQAIPTIVANIPQIIEAVVAVFTAFNWVSLGKNIITLLKDGIIGMVGAVKSAGQSIFDAVKNAITNLPSTLMTIGRNAGNLLSSGLRGMAGAARSAASSILSGIVGALTSLPSKLLSLAKTAATNIVNAFKSQNWLSIGSNIIKGIISGIGSAVGGLVDAAVDAASSAFNAAKNFLGIKSPSRLFRDEIGKMIPAGMAVGIEADTPEAVASVDAMVDRMAAAAQAAADAMQTKMATTVAVAQPEPDNDEPDDGKPPAPVPQVQNINFNYPVQAPDEIARELRIRETYGLGGGR